MASTATTVSLLLHRPVGHPYLRNPFHRLGPPSLTLPFLALNLTSIVLLTCLTLFTLVSRDAAQPVVVNTLGAMLVYCVGAIWT